MFAQVKSRQLLEFVAPREVQWHNCLYVYVYVYTYVYFMNKCIHGVLWNVTQILYGWLIFYKQLYDRYTTLVVVNMLSALLAESLHAYRDSHMEW